MENEIMDYQYENENEVVETEGTGMSTGVAMLIGAGITLAVGGIVKLVKKGVAAIKAKKEQQQTASEHDFVDTTEDGTK